MKVSRSKVSRVKIGNCPQVSSGSPSDRFDDMENGESRHTGDLRRVGGNPGVVYTRARDPRRGEHAANGTRAIQPHEFTSVVRPMHRAFVDSLRVPGSRSPVGESDGLPDPRAVRLDLLSGVLLPDELRIAPGADMHFLHVYAGQAVARRARQRREPTREETGHQARLRRRRRVRRLLVPYTGKEA